MDYEWNISSGRIHLHGTMNDTIHDICLWNIKLFENGLVGDLIWRLKHQSLSFNQQNPGIWSDITDKTWLMGYEIGTYT